MRLGCIIFIIQKSIYLKNNDENKTKKAMILEQPNISISMKYLEGNLYFFMFFASTQKIRYLIPNLTWT